MLFFRFNQVSRECPSLFVYSIRLRNTLNSMMRAMSVVDEAQTSDLLHGYSKSADMGSWSRDGRSLVQIGYKRLWFRIFIVNSTHFAKNLRTISQPPAGVRTGFWSGFARGMDCDR